MRSLWRSGLLLWCGLAGCSFIDDFGGYRAADAGLDGGSDGSLDGAPSGDVECVGKGDGTSCGSDGQRICVKGFCGASRCGDGFVDTDEQCDDENQQSDDGCEPESCRFSCETNADCDNGSVCDGDEICDITHRCMSGDMPTGLDGGCDSDPMSITCYPDRDGDGFPAREGSVRSATCAPGTRPARVDGEWDCWDDPSHSGDDVKPSQTGYFAVAYERTCPSGSGLCLSFDYNCDGAATPQFAAGSGSCSLLDLGCSGTGYVDAAPDCGMSGTYLVCEGGGLLCDGTPRQQRQFCH